MSIAGWPEEVYWITFLPLAELALDWISGFMG